jgi:hypothetical protein
MLTLKSVIATASASACAVVLLSTTACSTTEEVVIEEPLKVNCYIGNNPPVMLTPEECSARGGNTTRG